MFRLLKLSPPHGWKAVWWELAIVTLGVLIALGAQQAATRIDQAKDRRFAEAAMRDEIGLNAIMAFERLVVEDCLRNRIATLTQKLNSGDAVWRGNPLEVRSVRSRHYAMPGAYRTPTRHWSRAAWNTAVAAGVLKTMDRQRVSDLAYVYSQIDELAQLQQREAEQAARLSFLAFDHPLDQETRREALHALAAADATHSSIMLIAAQFIDRVRELRLGYNPDLLGGFAMSGARGPKAVIAAQRANRGTCVKNLPLWL